MGLLNGFSGYAGRVAILLTHALSYAGPGTCEVLVNQGESVICHDPAFIDAESVESFQEKYPNFEILMAQSPTEIFHESTSRGFRINKLIHNNSLANAPKFISEIPLDEFHSSFNNLFLFIVELTQLFLPDLKSFPDSSIVFITSARYLKPEAGYAVATSIRAGTTSFALALATEVAAHGISVNVVAPNYLYSETYYPRAKWIDDPVGQEQIKSIVPMGRLGDPSEIGELIAFLISGKSTFVTGQVINFTGGWPG